MSDGAERSDTEARRGLSAIAVATGLFALAFLVRALPFPRVFTADRIEFLGFDAYYHMRKVLYGVVHFPGWLDFDAYLKFPHGARPIWTPVFDTTVAWLALPFAAVGGERGVEAFAVFVPPLVGAATVVATWALARRIANGTVALASALLLAVTSAHAWYSQIGFVDHHVAVAALSLALFASALPLLRRHPAESRFTGLAFGALLALCLALWPGMLVHVGLVEAAVWLHAASAPDRETSARAVTRLAWAHGLAAVVLLPLWFAAHPEQWSAYSSVVLSRFQPWLACWLAATAAIAALAWTRTAAGASTVGRVGSALVAGGIGLGVSLALLPDLAVAVSDAWKWMAKDEAFQASIGESQPLFLSRGAFHTFIPELRFSKLVYLFPVAWLAWCTAAWRRDESDRSIWLAVALWAGGLAALTLLQRRFMNSFAVPYAIVWGWALVSLARLAAERIPSGRGPRLAFVAGGIAMLGFALSPMMGAYRGSVSDIARWLNGAAPAPDPSKVEKLPTLLAGEWLRRNTPKTSGYFDASARPEYGVLSLWGDGHVLRYTARRAVVTDNFGDDLGPENFDRSTRYFAAERESEADAILGELGVRYVVVRPGSATGKHFEALYRRSGNGLAHHRLVFETPDSELTAGRAPVRVFERVKGASITGTAQPGALVTASLGYRTPRGRRGSYQASAVANARGQYAIRVPHATDRAAGVALETDATYQLRSGSVEAPVPVSEFDVQEGRRVPGPVLGR